MIDTTFTHHKHCFLSIRNIEHACFTALDLSINNAFKVSNNPAIQGSHAGMSCKFILDQLLELYGHPTPAILEQNKKVFCSPYLAANFPKVLFRRIEDCVEIALLGQDLYMDCQLINNAIHLLLMTGLYLHSFEEWDHLLPAGQTWIVLHMMIQESFQQCLNVTAPMAGHHGYAPALPFQQNAFGALAGDDDSDNCRQRGYTGCCSDAPEPANLIHCDQKQPAQ
jgi:hypothetical protein